MIDAGIMPDDFVVIKRQDFAQVGETVVALIGEEATVKRLMKSQGKYFLAPANPKYQPIPMNENVSIIGKVVHVVREYK